ncbi:MAG: chromate transporter [Bacteroidales bacterium]|nr:chromate transporter [Bacteroidales bacterium]
MIFLELFYTFLLIGLLTFGGGYSMVALIQGEVVTHHGWMSAAEFTDLLAVSQMTPGPVGINTATYAGYTAVLNAGYPQWAAVGGSLLASLAVIILPVALTMLVGGWLLRHKEHPTVATVMRMLRLAIVGLIAAAALGLVSAESFGMPGLNRRFITSVLIFAAVFLLSWRKKASPIALILASGVAGLVIYSF